MINNFPLDNDAEDYADRVRISEKYHQHFYPVTGLFFFAA
jgi:hypothetical protein